MHGAQNLRERVAGDGQLGRLSCRGNRVLLAILQLLFEFRVGGSGIAVYGSGIWV